MFPDSHWRDRVTLKMLRYFHAVACHGHFSRAAEQLNVSKSPLSAQIKERESVLGLALFERHTRQVSLTATGRLLLDGDIISPADGDAITMRRRISGDGVLIVVLARGAKPVIEAIGLPLDEDLPDFLEEAAGDVLTAINRLKGKDARDVAVIREAARLAARRAAQGHQPRQPLPPMDMRGAGGDFGAAPRGHHVIQTF